MGWGEKERCVWRGGSVWRERGVARGEKGGGEWLGGSGRGKERGKRWVGEKLNGGKNGGQWEEKKR